MASAASVASVARCSILWLRLHEYHPLPPSLLHFARNPSLSILPRFRPNVLLLLAPLLLLLLSSFSICHEFAIRSSPSILRSWLERIHPRCEREQELLLLLPPPPPFYYDYTRLTRIYERVCSRKFRACVCVNTRVLLLLHLFLRMYT